MTQEDDNWKEAEYQVKAQHSCNQQQWDWSNARETAISSLSDSYTVEREFRENQIQSRLKNANAIAKRWGNEELAWAMEAEIWEAYERNKPSQREEAKKIAIDYAGTSLDIVTDHALETMAAYSNTRGEKAEVLGTKAKVAVTRLYRALLG